MSTPLTGLVDASRVNGPVERVPIALIERLRTLGDLTATISDILDQLGVVAVAGASSLIPTSSDATLVGTAITVRKAPQSSAPGKGAAAGEADMGEIEGANQAGPGDVLVIEGLEGVSAMGGLMSTMAKRQGAAGAVVDGGVRDVAHARALGFPIWSSEITPVTGKWRSEVVEVNGPVSIAGCAVNPGDLVVADETGVAFVPADQAPTVVERAEGIAAAESGYADALAGDAPLHELIRAFRGS